MNILKFKSDECLAPKMDVNKINSEFISSFNGFSKPTAVMNFDLVFLSPTYNNKMKEVVE